MRQKKETARALVNSSPDDPPIIESTTSIERKEPRLSAAQWEREVAKRFLLWRGTSGPGRELMRTFAEAVTRTLYKDGDQFAQSGQLASKLPAVLTSCDTLTFEERLEALAYSALHLVDRYGRVDQVLEYLISIGRLPLRFAGARLLEVGAGPAPALYAARDFYVALSRWPGRGNVRFGPLGKSDTLDRGPAWDPLLHHLSEELLMIRGGALSDGYLAWDRTINDFAGFDVRERHHRSVARSAERLADELREAGEPISDASARQMAYEEGVREPSEYDMVFLCNFLTQQRMTEKFELELHRLSLSLTPGGLLIVIGATGGIYPDIYSKIRAIAATAKLWDVSPKEVFQANAEPYSLSLIAEHVRQNVKFALRNCPTWIRSAVINSLPKDLFDDKLEFKLPKFQALIFVRQGPQSKKKPKS